MSGSQVSEETVFETEYSLLHGPVASDEIYKGSVAELGAQAKGEHPVATHCLQEIVEHVQCEVHGADEVFDIFVLELVSCYSVT